MRRALVLWLAIPFLAAASSSPPDMLLETAVDGKGMVWACHPSRTGHVWRYDGTNWSVVPLPFTQSERAFPVQMVAMRDGAVECIWRIGEHTIGVSRHLGDETRILGTCDGEMHSNELASTPLVDAQNRLWITGDFPGIYRADAQGVHLVREIASAELDMPGRGNWGYNNVHAAEDGHGRIWVWSMRGASNYVNLHGVLIFTGDKSDLHVALGGINTANISAIVRADDQHMWVAVAQDGIYRVDIDTLAAEKEKEPRPQLFLWTHELFANGNDLYAVVATPGTQTELWRRRGSQWSEIVHQFDIRSAIFGDRWWLPVKEGLLVQSFGGGPWFISKEGAPARFSWETEPPLGETRALVRLPDGTFFGLDRMAQIFHGALSLPPHPRASSRVTMLDGEAGWVVAATGHIWMLSHQAPLVLKEWDDFKWTSYDLPSGAQNPGDLCEDDQGRLWTMAKVVLVFDPKTGQWQTFPDYDAAFLAMKDRSLRFLNDRWFRGPQYSVDRKRIAYRRDLSEIRYFDGMKWQKWRRKEITKETGYDSPVGPPWFDGDGHLRINIRNKTGWMLTDSGQWTSAKYQSHFPADIWSENAVNRSLFSPAPEGCVTSHPDSCVIDNLGTYWLTWQGALYRAIPGLCVKVFSDDEPNPFCLPEQLREAYMDGQGNAFLLTAATTMERIMIRPKAPAPKTVIIMEKKSLDSMVAHLDAHTTSAVTFRWQLDDDAPALSHADSIPFDHLPNGSHVLKVSAMDDQLNSEPTPATAKFEIHVDREKQLTLLVAQLADPDYDRRKAAVEALALQPAEARPLLLKARETASEEYQWWIDAALQEGEQAKSCKK